MCAPATCESGHIRVVLSVRCHLQLAAARHHARRALQAPPCLRYDTVVPSPVLLVMKSSPCMIGRAVAIWRGACVMTGTLMGKTEKNVLEGAPDDGEALLMLIRCCALHICNARGAADAGRHTSTIRTVDGGACLPSQEASPHPPSGVVSAHASGVFKLPNMLHCGHFTGMVKPFPLCRPPGRVFLVGSSRRAAAAGGSATIPALPPPPAAQAHRQPTVLLFCLLELALWPRPPMMF